MLKVAMHFAAIDTDKDGTVSLEEVHTYMKGRHTASNNYGGRRVERAGGARIGCRCPLLSDS